MNFKTNTAERSTITRDTVKMEKTTGNIYESIVAMSKRSNQISVELKEELTNKLQEFASSTDNIQVQRGVGTSSNGAAAFGSSINIKTDNIEKRAYAELDNSVGSFSTLRNTVKAGTGLINDKFVVDARLSRISSDGFIDRASSNLKSFYLSGAWIGKKSLVKANIFSGKEITYQAWYGIPEAKLYGNNSDLLTHFYNNYYPGGLYETPADSANLFNSKPNTYNYYSYDNEVDNLRKICSEVFGEKNFIACIANTNNPKGRSDDKFIATAHERGIDADLKKK